MLTLDIARKLISGVFEHAATLELKPLGVAVLDPGGHVIAFEKQDGASNMRFQIAFGKANGALAMGLGSRTLYERAKNQPYFINAMNTLANGALVPVPGGILIRDDTSRIIGAVGVTGDNSNNDERCAIHAIENLGLVADAG